CRVGPARSAVACRRAAHSSARGIGGWSRVGWLLTGASCGWWAGVGAVLRAWCARAYLPLVVAPAGRLPAGHVSGWGVAPATSRGGPTHGRSPPLRGHGRRGVAEQGRGRGARGPRGGGPRRRRGPRRRPA